jgi:hypothetical protein
MRLTPVFRRTMARMRLFYGHEPVYAGPGRCVIVFTAGLCGVDGQSRILSSGQHDRASRGKSADEGEGYNPTLSCANRYFMIFRMTWDRIRFCPSLSEEESTRKRFFYLDSL